MIQLPSRASGITVCHYTLLLLLLVLQLLSRGSCLSTLEILMVSSDVGRLELIQVGVVVEF